MFSFTQEEKDRFIEIIYRAYRKTEIINDITFDTLRWTFEIDYAYSDKEFIKFLKYQRDDMAKELICSGHVHLNSQMFQLAIDRQSTPAIEWLCRNGCPQRGQLTISAWLLCSLIE